MNEATCRRVVRTRSVEWDDTTDEFMEHLPCEGCGQWCMGYEMHHRKFRSRGGLWVPSNILLLCRRCHDDATHERPFAVDRGFNVPTHADPRAVPVKVWYVSRPVLLDDDGGWLPWGGITPGL